MTASEAAKILGVTTQQIQKWQREGFFPKPIPDDYLNSVIDFRLRLEQTMRRKVDRERGLNADHE